MRTDEDNTENIITFLAGKSRVIMLGRSESRRQKNTHFIKSHSTMNE
jgi:hypothetical protein